MVNKSDKAGVAILSLFCGFIGWGLTSIMEDMYRRDDIAYVKVKVEHIEQLEQMLSEPKPLVPQKLQPKHWWVR